MRPEVNFCCVSVSGWGRGVASFICMERVSRGCALGGYVGVCVGIVCCGGHRGVAVGGERRATVYRRVVSREGAGATYYTRNTAGYWWVVGTKY